MQKLKINIIVSILLTCRMLTTTVTFTLLIIQGVTRDCWQ